MIDLQYFGNLTFYKKLYAADYVVFSICDPYQKGAFLNRCTLATANGPLLLTVPLENGRNQRCNFKDVKIAKDINWQSGHFKSICSAYNGSPWFEHYTDGMADLFSIHVVYLTDWNLACLDWVLDKLKRPLTYSLADACSVAEISEIEEMHSPRYHQVFEARTGFIPGCSVIDLLFCEGPYRALSVLLEK